MKQTLFLNAEDTRDLTRAADWLRDGRLVAFPTETVYGLGANALNESAVAAIFEAKERPSWDPLIVHIAHLDDLWDITDIPAGLEPLVRTLADAFWPGPLTLLLPRADSIPDAVTAGRPLVGVRIPGHPIALTLLEWARVPVAAPSANRFGHTSPTTAFHVLDDLDGRIDAVLDAGPTTVGLESTVLDPATMTLYRPGAITAEALTELTGLPVTIYEPPTTPEEPESLPAPGVGIRHYAPNARLITIEGGEAAFYAALASTPATEGLAVLLPEDWPTPETPDLLIEPWAPWTDPEALAANLFAALRSLDDQQATLILAPLPEPGGLHDALRDRMLKAAR